MPYQIFKKHLISRLKSENESYSFEGSFAEALQRKTSHEESVILMLALAPHILPHFLDETIKAVFPEGGEIPQLGGSRSSSYRGFLPTGETVQYILAGEDIAQRIEIIDFFSKEHWFYAEDILSLESVPEGEPMMSGRIMLSQKAISLLVYGEETISKTSIFAANKITTQLDWQDLVLAENTIEKIKEILIWEKNKKIILHDWGQSKFFKKGYRVLFYGPSGTGKTLTAALLGKELSKIREKEVPVYRIDLSLMVSKYIGETEKNLEKLFQKAENKEWILFFDEGETLFGQRTGVKDSNDKYANQEISFLLQRIEDYNGLVIVATNLKTNMDSAFTRRFQSMVEFKIPSDSERRKLWQNIFPNEKFISKTDNLVEQLIKHPLSGGEILNVVQYACLKASEMENPEITLENCISGIKMELAKSGRTL